MNWLLLAVESQLSLRNSRLNVDKPVGNCGLSSD